MRLASAVLAAFASAVALPAIAQSSYPARPIRLIVASAPGGAPDILGRAIAQKLTESLGQQVVVDNRAGASGIIGAELTAKSAPDGYTVLLGTTTLLAMLPVLKPRLAYDPVRDFAPVTQIAVASNIVVINASIPARTIADLVKLAKSRPLNFASAGNGTPAHLAGELFNILAGTKIVHVPYKGAGPALTDLIGGQVQLLITSPIAALPHIGSGKLRALATTGAKRNPALPDLPTVAETLPGYEITQWWGLCVPAKTAGNIVARLQQETALALRQPDVRERIAREGAVAVGSTPVEFAAFIAAEKARVTTIIQQARIPLED
jgi:tripartite-type tricarboxylate transporter receptor subunit TctC